MGQAVTQGDETVLVTGGGQLAGALGRQAWPAGLTPLYLPRDRLDITDREAVAAVLRAHPISAIINTAAWTDVDGAEAAERQAYAVNAEAPALLADAAERAGACLIHVSTDYVFGHGQGPWDEEARTAPLNVYGASKLAGEKAVLRPDTPHRVVRTSWVFDSCGRNFVTTMLGLADRPQLQIIDDQWGTPTAAADLAASLIELARTWRRPTSQRLLHFANSGQATRYDMAEAVFERLGRSGVTTPLLERVSSASRPCPAVRPSDSRLDIGRWTALAGQAPRHWRAALDQVVDDWAARRGEGSQ